MRRVTAALLFLLIAAPALASRDAGAAVPGTTQKALVIIEPIADSGGAGQKMGDGETLARRFTKGLRAALEGAANERFRVESGALSKSETAIPATFAARFVLRGGLSRVQESDSKNGDQPYLCIVRLFQENVTENGARKTRRLVGQWAGTARGLRDLTGNLSRDPRVHVLGLAGELSRRVAAVTLRLTDPSAPAPPPVPVPAGDTAPAVSILDGGISLPSPASRKPAPATKQSP